MNLLRIKDVCKMLKISESTLANLRSLPDFPEAYELGCTCIYVWDESEIIKWVKKQRRVKL